MILLNEKKHLFLLLYIFVSLNLFAQDKTILPSEEAFYKDYEHVLEKYVNDKGLVNYSLLKLNRTALDRFIKSLGSIKPEIYNQWNNDRKLAFWINSYNACTLKVIIDNFPIKSSFLTSLRYPKNSIRQISGVWDEKSFNIAGRRMTLNDIEHKTIRTKFEEPRIHMALVCASVGCPLLRSEPYIGKILDEQLDDQTVSFLKDPNKFNINRAANIVSISPIFKWFQKDFFAEYSPAKGFGKISSKHKAVINFHAKYLPEKDTNYLINNDYTIKFLDYDWSLNEQ